MSLFYTLIFLLCAFCDSQPVTPPKSKSNAFNFKSIVAGNRSLNVTSSDPLVADIIQGDFPDVKYLFYRPKMHGFKDCNVQDFNLSFEKRRLYFELLCPRLNIYGFYQTKGDVFNSVYIEGEGDANIVIYDYLIKMYAPISINQGPKGKAYIYLDKFYGQYIPQGPVLLHFDSLYPGRKDLSDAAQRMLNENSKELMLAYGHPFMDAL